MPFQSEKQRRFMWSQHPEIAKRWADEGKGYVVDKSKGGTTSSNGPVGTAGQPSSTDASGKGGNGKGLKKHEKNDDARFAAIQRRIDNLKGKGGK